MFPKYRIVMKLDKYHGAGNDFLIADNRDGSVRLSADDIAALCDRHYGLGADGLMMLEKSDRYAFRMEYYNSDGSGGMMCGNGGRCIAAFAIDNDAFGPDFEAPDGLHTAQLQMNDGPMKIIRLKMKDVSGIDRHKKLDGIDVPSDGYFLDTGTRHYVRMVSDLDGYDVVGEGRIIRYVPELGPVGANVNFIEPCDGVLKVRTYEKGVEDETFACGTGIVASSIAAYFSGIAPTGVDGDRVYYDIKAKKDGLRVDFIPTAGGAEDVWLTGPAVYVGSIYCDVDQIVKFYKK